MHAVVEWQLYCISLSSLLYLLFFIASLWKHSVLKSAYETYNYTKDIISQNFLDQPKTKVHEMWDFLKTEGLLRNLLKQLIFSKHNSWNKLL
jgi:hypothetical protein